MKILFFTLITIPFLIACSKPEYKNEHKINYKTIKNLSCQNLKATGILQLDTLKIRWERIFNGRGVFHL